MRKLISIVFVLALCLSILAVGASAAATGTLNGPSVVRAGDTITLTLKLSGQNLYVARGVLSYDTNQLEKISEKQLIGGAWKIDFNNNIFLATDENMETPINKDTNLLSVTFKVKNVAPGTKITVSYNDVTATDGSKDIEIGTVSWSATVAEPLSTDNTLKSLTVSNATISPAFNANTTTYTAQVPFDVKKLDISATANHGKATVSVNSPNLTPGGTTKVTVTVKAENGSTKTYTINVTRAQDPNYQASGNNDLSGISVNGFLLSPGFSAGTTNYVIWLPYETDSVTVSGTAADSNASVRVEGGSNLAAGQDNVIKVICTAENGTEKVYTIIAKRAAAHDGSVDPTPTEPVEPTNPQGSEPQQTQPQGTQPKEEAPVVTESDNAGGVPVWLVIVAAIAGLGVGFAIGMVIKKKQ